MSRPRECAHTERYKDGRCKICTRSRHKKYIADKRATARLRASRMKAGGPRFTLEELMDAPPKKPPCDLI